MKTHQIDPNGVRGVASFPFKLGEHQRIAVKVIDSRENEVVRVVPAVTVQPGCCMIKLPYTSCDSHAPELRKLSRSRPKIAEIFVESVQNK